LSTSIGFDNPEASLDLAREVAPYFGLKSIDTRDSIREVSTVTPSWSNAAPSLGFSKSEIDAMESAFEHEDLRFAKTLA